MASAGLPDQPSVQDPRARHATPQTANSAGSRWAPDEDREDSALGLGFWASLHSSTTATTNANKSKNCVCILNANVRDTVFKTNQILQIPSTDFEDLFDSKRILLFISFSYRRLKDGMFLPTLSKGLNVRRLLSCSMVIFFDFM